ncbi:ankyrin repeat domain-containing protein [Candidatus Sororendozoicomonas aggregata]|uniref:ankyrin repeat domain-containing protein n=1 Tax=Candidatus Sororendozoicomonas aggregata TaxID=3073239 RepID=UPI002ED11B3E
MGQAISCRSIPAVERFLEEGVSINSRGDHNMTPLMTAASLGSFRMLSYFIQLGADLNLVDYYGQSALTLSITNPFAASNRKARMVRALLRAGANPNIGVAWHVPPFKRPSDRKNADDKDVWGCFGQAARRREFDIGEVCLDFGARPLTTSKLKRDPDVPDATKKTFERMVKHRTSLESQTVNYISRNVNQDKLARLGIPPALLKDCFSLPNTPAENAILKDAPPTPEPEIPPWYQ